MTNAPMSWNEYFETHPEFAKLSFKAWMSRDGSLSRMYFGESYLEREIVEEGRVSDQNHRRTGYYDRHRIAKGDTMAVISDDVTWVGDDQLFATICAKAGTIDLAELWQRFVALANRPKPRRRK